MNTKEFFVLVIFFLLILVCAPSKKKGATSLPEILLHYKIRTKQQKNTRKTIADIERGSFLRHDKNWKFVKCGTYTLRNVPKLLKGMLTAFIVSLR